LCEAGCGLEITVASDPAGEERVTRIRGDQLDVFSKGFICPKGSTLKQLHEDPDRLRRPLVKRNGVHVEVSWAEAFSEVAERLTAVTDRYGRQAVATYLGNPSAHSLSALLYNRPLLMALGTKQRFSASTVDQMPRHVASGLVFGTPMTVPVPDLDRTRLLMMLGANPYASNGSLCTAPDFPGRIEAMQARGGRLIVVDPRRSRSAEQADEWIAIRPGTDALLLAAIAKTLFDEDLSDVGAHVGAHLNGLDEVRQALAGFGPERVSAATGVAADVIVGLAHQLANAESAALYGRIGTTTTEFGTLASWLIDVVNILTGNLDREGGSMFSMPVAGGPTTKGTPGIGHGFETGKGSSRIGGHPEVMGEYPAAAMAEEISTPGDGQIKALITIAGNPVLSTPNSVALDLALAGLDLMVSVDIYLNETTKHADVILPPPSPLQRSHYDLALLQFAVRNVANYSEPVLALDEDQPDEWEILCRLALIAQGLGPDGDIAIIDDMAAQAVARMGSDPDGMLAGASAGGRRGPERLLDMMLRAGPFGITLDDLIAAPHGIDFGPLEPRLPEILRTPTGRIELAAQPLLDDLLRLEASIEALTDRTLVLVGRRDLRSNNSWMHNIEVLVKGRPRCTLHVHPDDAARLGVTDGGPATVTSRVGQLTAVVEVTEAIRPGVVSLPHGWGHDHPGTQLRIASERAGVNSNVLTDQAVIDPMSGNAALNAIPVSVVPA
jgi:anaerobic selenocysteine-containing dehydrogenase